MDAVLHEYLYPSERESLSRGRVITRYMLCACPIHRSSFFATVQTGRDHDDIQQISVEENGQVYWHNLLTTQRESPRIESGTLDGTIGCLELRWRSDPGEHRLIACYEGEFMERDAMETMRSVRNKATTVNKDEPVNWAEEGF